MIFEIDLLNDEQLEYIRTYFNYLQYVDGRVSNPAVPKICETCYTGPGSLDLNNYCQDLISETSLPFPLAAVSQVYFIKYHTGGKYDDHYDAQDCGGVRTDYSMTCFLSDEYTGGELVVAKDGKEITFEMQKGKAIIYPGNLLHRVNEVKSGRRDVFICWLQAHE